MNNRTKSLKNICYQALNQALTIGLGVLLPHLFVVNYGSEVNGLLGSLNQLLVYLGLFEAGIGAATLQALYAPVGRQDWARTNAVLSAAARYYKKAGVCYLGALLLFSLLYPLVVPTELPFFTVFAAALLSGAPTAVNFLVQAKYRFFLQSDGRLYVFTNLTSLTNILVNLAKILLIWRGADIVRILLAAFLLRLIQPLWIVFYVRRTYPQLDLHAQPDYAAVAQKNSVLVHQISGLIFQNTDVLILTLVCGLKVVSVYSLFRLVTSNLESIAGILPNSISFSLGQTYQLDKDAYARRHDLFESLYSAVAFAFLAVALYLYLPFMSLYTAGVTDINYCDGKLAVLFVACSLLNVSRVFTNFVINFAGHFRQTLSRTIAEAAINLTVSLLGVYFLGIYGVLLGTVAALGYRTNDIIIYANTRLLGRSPRRTYAIYCVDLVLFFALEALFPLLFPAPESYRALILTGCGTTALALTVLFIGQFACFPHVRSGVQSLLSSLRRRSLS